MSHRLALSIVLCSALLAMCGPDRRVQEVARLRSALNGTPSEIIEEDRENAALELEIDHELREEIVIRLKTIDRPK